MDKEYPEIGTPLYLHQQTGNSWVDMCKYPYTVIGIESGKVVVQEAECIFNGPRYYDTLADDIIPNPKGDILRLNWSSKYGRWQVDRYKTGYPQIAVFGSYQFQPYLN